MYNNTLIKKNNINEFSIIFIILISIIFILIVFINCFSIYFKKNCNCKKKKNITDEDINKILFVSNDYQYFYDT